MENNIAENEDIQKRNTSVEIYRRLNRSSRLSFVLGLHVHDLSMGDSIFTLCIGDILSYLHDDIDYVLKETKKGGAYNDFLESSKH
ncbi:Derepression protein [Salmonella enterica]|nr:Derepression protein [Salmonella enterica]